MHAYTAMLVCLHVVNADMLKYSSARLHFSVCMLLGLLVYLFVCAFAGVCVCVCLFAGLLVWLVTCFCVSVALLLWRVQHVAQVVSCSVVNV